MPMRRSWVGPLVAGLLLIVIAAGCAAPAPGGPNRQKMVVELADALWEEALSVPQDSQRQRLVTGMTQLRELVTPQPALKPTGAAAGEPNPARGADPLLFAPTSMVIGFFTKPRSFGNQGADRGLEVRLQPLDQFGDPVKVVGSFRIEVFACREEGGENRGERLGHWFIPLMTVESNRTHYDRVDRCYVFPLLWEKGVAPPKAVAVQAAYYLPNEYRERLSAQRLIKLEEEKSW